MDMTQAINRVLDQGVRNGAVPGVVAAVGNREGVLYEGAFGERALGSGQAMTTDTVCWIASMTKAVTSVAALQCVERGLLALDEPARRICPELGDVGVLTGFDAQGQPLTRPPKRDITLRHLLTHSAGFSYEIWNTDMQKVQAAWGIPSVTECKDKALSLPLLFDPGSGWEYGINIDWAGRRRLASTHLRGEDGTLAVFPFEIPQQPEFEMGGGGLYSTAGDYLRFLRMVLNLGQLGGERILSPEGALSLGMNHMGDCRVYKLKAAIPLTNDAEFFEGIPKSWSLAFQINHEPAPTGRPAGGLMWAGLANSYYWLDPSKGLAGVYITQIFPFADHRSLPLYYDFEKAVYDAR